jgi:hypothetical protein
MARVNPFSRRPEATIKKRIPGFVADEAGNGPGMTTILRAPAALELTG